MGNVPREVSNNLYKEIKKMACHTISIGIGRGKML
jgi:hypothetical protein